MSKKEELIHIVNSFEVHDLELRNSEVRFLDDKILIHAWDAGDKRAVEIEFVNPVYFAASILFPIYINVFFCYFRDKIR